MSSPPPRRWSARLRSLLHLRPSRRRSASPSPSLPEGGRRRRSRRAVETRLTSARASQASLRYRRQDLEALDAEDTADIRASPPSGGLLEEGEEQDLMAMVERLFYEVDAERFPSSAVYVRGGRAVRVPHTYLIARRGGRHSHLTVEIEREMSFRPRTLRLREVGATEERIAQLPTFVMEKGEMRSVKEVFESMGAGAVVEESSECAICLGVFEGGDEICLLPCGHFFHLTGCVKEWLRDHASTCPSCRRDISEGTA